MTLVFGTDARSAYEQAAPNSLARALIPGEEPFAAFRITDSPHNADLAILTGSRILTVESAGSWETPVQRLGVEAVAELRLDRDGFIDLASWGGETSVVGRLVSGDDRALVVDSLQTFVDSSSRSPRLVLGGSQRADEAPPASTTSVPVGVTSVGESRRRRLHWRNLFSIRFWIGVTLGAILLSAPFIAISDALANVVFVPILILLVYTGLRFGDPLDCARCGKNIKAGHTRCHHCGFDSADQAD